MDPERINCAYCKRRGVLAAEPTEEVVFKDPKKPPIIFTTAGMCADCARMFVHGASRALKAFAEEIARLRKITKVAPKPVSWDHVSKEVDQFLKALGLAS